MKRLTAIILLLAGTASAQNVAYLTNNVLALSASSSPLVWYVDYQARLTVLARRGSLPVDLTGSRVELVLSDRRDGLTVKTVAGSIIDATNGYSTATMTMTGLEPGPYIATMSAIDEETGAKITDLSLNNITLTNWCDGCGSSGSASVNISSGAVQVAVQAGVTGNTFEVQAGDVVASGDVIIPSITVNNTTITTGIVGIAVSTNDAPAGVTTNESGVAVINVPPVGAAGLVLIASWTGNGADNTVTFSDLPQNYAALKLIGSPVCLSGSGSALFCKLNGSSANYAGTLMRYGFGVSDGALGTNVAWHISGLGDTTNYGSSVEATFINYSSASLFKSFISHGFASSGSGTPASSYYTMVGGGYWRDTAAVTSLTLYAANSQPFINRTVFYLYGVSL